MTTWLALVLVSLASYRTWRLLALDTILDRPRNWLLKDRSQELDDFVTCPWCLGFWVTVGWCGAWWAWDGTPWVAVPFAVSAVVGFLNYLGD